MSLFFISVCVSESNCLTPGDSDGAESFSDGSSHVPLCWTLNICVIFVFWGISLEKGEGGGYKLAAAPFTAAFKGSNFATNDEK